MVFSADCSDPAADSVVDSDMDFADMDFADTDSADMDSADCIAAGIVAGNSGKDWL